MVVLVDLVLGPFLTLIVYNPRKARKELLLDLALIAFMQLLALAWGVTSVYQQRPVAAAYWSGSFYTVPAKALQDQGADLQVLQQYGTETPVYVFVEPPHSNADHETMLNEMEVKKIPPHEQFVRYRPLNEHSDSLRASSLDIEEIISTNSGMRAELEKVLALNAARKEDNYYVPLISRYRNIILVFSKENELLGMLNAPMKEGPQ